MMNTILVLFLVMVGATAQAQDPYYQITSLTNETIETTTEALEASDLEFAPTVAELPSVAFVDPYLIAQILIKAWDFVVKNKPVVNADVKNVSALPVMADYKWNSLTGWKPERVVKNKLVCKNGFGQETVNIEYLVRLMYGGGVRGRGQYIASLAIVPKSVKVLWGYTVDARVTVPSVVNVGTADDPNAAITLEINYKVATMLAKRERKDSFYAQGDGFFRNQKTGNVYFEAVDHPTPPPLSAPPTVPAPDPTLPTDLPGWPTDTTPSPKS